MSSPNTVTIGDPRAAPRSPAERIEQRTARLCVVGLGYVGLTVACALAERGFGVVGIEVDPARAREISRGTSPLPDSEPRLAELLAEHAGSGRLHVTQDPAGCAAADIILIAVQTPVADDTHAPALGALRAAVTSVGQHMPRGVLVIVESTIPPGTMRDVVVPLLEQASGLSATADFLVGCCPERVMPGRLLANLALCSRVMGGWTADAADVGALLYRVLTSGSVDVTDCLTAELVKTAENAYRDVQIAFANEVALLCESYRADVYAVRELVNKSPDRWMHWPGAGVGGHCIPKDPWLLVANADKATPVRLIPAARAVNDSMPSHVGDMVTGLLAAHGRPLAESRIVVLGYAYLQDSDDARNSPSAELVRWLEERGARVAVQDPLVAGCERLIEPLATGADCLVLMVAHSAYRSLDLRRIGELMRTRTLADGRHMLDRTQVEAAGFTYYCLGVGLPAAGVRATETLATQARRLG
jgi:UDP-N-acetyl-D-mannosaminuronic acid dehydrogenase